MRVCSICQRCYDDSVANCSEDSHPDLSETRGGSPGMIAGYRLDTLIVSGLKGDTFRAHQTASDASCLIRILSADAASGQQFLSEAKLAITLIHPNVVDTYEADSFEGGFYAVAEEPDGQTLREYLRADSRPPLLTTIRIVCHAAEALHALHLRGLVHRAVRPENIILATDAYGRDLVRIQDPDFGGVAQTAMVSNKFLIDTALDSIRYFAPEQCSGQPVSIQTDVYGLGVVLYEMLAGSVPFDEPKASLLIEKIKNQPPPDVRIDNFDLRMLLTHTLTESLQKPPRLRQSSANAFARQLRHMEQLATHVSTPPPAGVVPAPTPRRIAAATAPDKPTQPRPLQPLSLEGSNCFTEEVKAPAVAADAENRLAAFEVEYPSPVTAKVDDEPLDISDTGILPAVMSQLETVAAFKPGTDPLSTVVAEDELAVSFEAVSMPVMAESPGAPLINSPEDTEAIGPIPEVPVAENLVDEEFVPVRRRPRLNLRSRRPRIDLVPPAIPSIDIPESKPVFPIEPAEFKAADVQPSPAEIPAIQTKPDIAEGAPPRQPNRIEWEMPEDDIPTEADVLEVLLRDELTQAADIPPISQFAPPEIFVDADPPQAVDPLPAENLPPVITTNAVEDVSEVVCEENIAPATANIESVPDVMIDFGAVDSPTGEDGPPLGLRAEAAAIPAVELERPVDELPAIPEGCCDEPIIADQLAEEISVPAYQAATPELETPKHSALPVVETALEPQAVRLAHFEAAPADLRLVQPEWANTVVASSTHKPAKIEWEMPEDDVPSEAEVLEVLRQERSIAPVVVRPPAQYVSLDLLPDEDFTWNTADEARLSPAVLREIREITEAGKRKLADPNPRDVIFASYGSLHGARFSVGYRPMMIGGGFAALIAMLLFGGLFVSRQGLTESPSEQVATKAAPAQKPEPPAAQPNAAIPNRPRAVKSFDKPQPEDEELDASMLKPLPADDASSKTLSGKEPQPLPKEKAEASAPKAVVRSQTPKATVVAPSSAKLPPVNFRIVIYSENGKIKSRVEEEKPDDKKSPSMTSKSSTTRPRVVKNRDR